MEAGFFNYMADLSVSVGVPEALDQKPPVEPVQEPNAPIEPAPEAPVAEPEVPVVPAEEVPAEPK
jgi:hypothetical protein